MGTLTSLDFSPSLPARLIAAVCLIWYFFVVLVCLLGVIQLRRYFSHPASSPLSPFNSTKPLSSSTFPTSIPLVTIIRPVKGLDTHLSACLASTFHQDYPADRLTIFFCVSSRSDAAFSTLESVISENPGFDTKVLVEDEDPLLNEPGGEYRLGPNPKIRNMSRAYREAKGDIIWMLDCNVWVGRDTLGRMVDRLDGWGFDGHGPYDFVHLLPIVVNTPPSPDHTITHSETSRLLEPQPETKLSGSTDLETFGARLEELFFSSSHAKFYSAINTVAIAPCIVGKSNMYRKSRLDSITPKGNDPPRNKGLDYFSDYICEDHLVGDLLWKSHVPGERPVRGKARGKHSLVAGCLAIQPMAQMSTKEFIARRVRWLRVRKYTVILATLVEPGTESILCSLYGAYAYTTLVPTFSLPYCSSHTSNGWLAFFAFFFTSILLWMQIDRYTYLLLHSGASVEPDDSAPKFVTHNPTKSYTRWVQAWVGRELLALPIWTWAFWFGNRVVWRGQAFDVGMNMRVKPVLTQKTVSNGNGGTKARSD